MSALKRIVAVVPGPALVFAQSWVTPFSLTHFANPEWSALANNSAIAVGTVIVVILGLVLGNASSSCLKTTTLILFGITILLFVACWFIWFKLGPPGPGVRSPNGPWWNDVWEGVYSLAMVFLVTSISVAALSMQEKTPWLRILVIVSVLLLLAAITIYFFWLR